MVKETAKKYYRALLISRSRRELSRLAADGGAGTTALANALRGTFRKETSTDERNWVRAIERVRGELSSSRAEVLVEDHGAGSHGAQNGSPATGGPSSTISTSVVGSVCRQASKPPFWALLLFKLVRELQPATCLELGTCLGLSGSYQAAALKLNGRGKLVTMEGADALAVLARKTFDTLALDNVLVVSGRFQDHLDEVLAEHRPIDFAFLDGHHDEQATVRYFEDIYPCLADQSVLVFDDISWSAGMARAWERVVADKRIQISIDLSRVGICLIDDSIDEKRHYKIKMI